MKTFGCGLVTLFLLTSATALAVPETLMVGAASSLAEVANDLSGAWSTTSRRLVVSLGSSGALLRQLREGAPFDVVLFASSKPMSIAAETKLIHSPSRVTFASNRLVVVGSKKRTLAGVEDLLKSDFNRIALGEPQSVPVGEFAVESFKNLGIWTKIERRVVYATTARQTLAFVESGNAQAGIVFATDAASSPSLATLFQIPPSLHNAVEYQAAVAQRAAASALAADFCRFLVSPTAQALLARRGFLRPVKGPSWTF